MKPSRRALIALSLFASAPVAAAQNQLWIRQLGTDEYDAARVAAPDGSGGLYVSGRTVGNLGGPHSGLQDVWLAHYDGAGTQLWVRQLGTTAHDRAWAAAADGSGGVYVSGDTEGSLGGTNAGSADAWLARYDGAGNPLWIRQFGTSDLDTVRSAAPDGSGGVYVGGYTQGDLGGPNLGQADAWLARYDGAGNQLWILQFGTSSGEVAGAAAPDGSGGVYVSGATSGSLGGPHAGTTDVWLAHYDGGGNQLWILQFGTVNAEKPWAVAADGSGGLYVSGETTGPLGGPTAGGWDAWLAQYDGLGNQLWIRQFGTSNDDHPYSVAADGSGGFYVSGETTGSLGGPNAGSEDAWLARYGGAGNQLWIRQFGTSGTDRAWAAVADGSGGAYVSGYTGGSLGGPYAGSGDAWLARYTGDLGTPYCTPATPNSTGLPGTITATGSGVVIEDDVTLIASQLPPGQFGYFITSQTQGSFMPPGSQGFICLGGSIGRYNANVGQGPSFSLQIDLTSMPVNSPVAVQAGDTWNFQCWFRDSNPGQTNNFTDAVSVVFQ